MSNSIDEIIRQAMQQGDFDNLPQKGKKLNLDEYFELPEEVRIGYTLLKNAEFVPTEVQLLKEIAELEEGLKNEDGEPAAKIRKDIQDKRLKYNLLLEASRRRQK
jgi:hypothetical protein